MSVRLTLKDHEADLVLRSLSAMAASNEEKAKEKYTEPLQALAMDFVGRTARLIMGRIEEGLAAPTKDETE